ncbi:hypothetical protein HY346_00675 [Candidatus Microgenomates bacterium]|nr:hypothetical protein [Candidatus Microgenomates bacterium]
MGPAIIIDLLEGIKDDQRAADIAAAALKRHQIELRVAVEEFKSEFVGKQLAFKQAQGLKFWPKRRGQQWWGGRKWNHDGVDDHIAYEEATVQGSDDVAGVVVEGSSRDPYYRPNIVLDCKSFYYAVPLTTQNLTRMTVQSEEDIPSAAAV